jgi:hypothetical protein
MEDAKGPYDFEVDAMGENIKDENVEIESNGHRNQENYSYIVDNMTSLRVELQI